MLRYAVQCYAIVKNTESLSPGACLYLSHQLRSRSSGASEREREKNTRRAWRGPWRPASDERHAHSPCPAGRPALRLSKKLGKPLPGFTA